MFDWLNSFVFFGRGGGSAGKGRDLMAKSIPSVGGLM